MYKSKSVMYKNDFLFKVAMAINFLSKIGKKNSSITELGHLLNLH